MEFGRIRGNSGISGKFRGIQWGFVWRLVRIQWEFLGDFGVTPDFRENLGFGVASGHLGGQKAFAQTGTVWELQIFPGVLGCRAAPLSRRGAVPPRPPMSHLNAK